MDVLLAEYPEIFDILPVVDQGCSNGAVIAAYGKIAHFAMENLEGKVTLPKDAIGYIELQFEICRRYRAFKKLNLPALRGHPLQVDFQAGEILPKRSIGSKLEGCGLSQGFVDTFIIQYCLDFPDWVFLQSEAFRRDVAPFALKVSFPDMSYFFARIPKDLSEEKATHAVREIRCEIGDRIRMACGCL